MSRTTKHLAYLVSVPITVVAAVSLAADIENSTVASITGSSIGQSITGSSIGQSITGSSIGQSITGSSIGQSITGSSIGHSITGSSIGQSITGSSIGQSITGSSIGQSITGSSIGQSITGSSIGQSITGSSIGFGLPDSVYVVGQISEIDSLAGTINLGNVLVYLGSVDTARTAALGSVVVVTGIQSVVGGLVVAESITALASSDDDGDDGVGNLMSITGSSISNRTIR